MQKPQMRFSRDGKRILLNDVAIELKCYVLALENNEGTVFKLMSNDGAQILQTMN